jgi:hypothetical protein
MTQASDQPVTERPAQSVVVKRRGGAPLGNSNRLVHGTYRRRKALKAIDWSTQLDRRTALYIELKRRMDSILAEEGGEERLTKHGIGLAKLAAQTEFEIDATNTAINEHAWLIDRRRRAIRTIVHDRNKLVATYVMLREKIRNERVEPATNLATYLASKGGQTE